MKNMNSSLRTCAVVAGILSLSLLGACSGDDLVNPGPSGPKGIIVLDGFIQPGLTLLGDTGSTSSRITFGPPTEFDAGAFTLERDTVLAVSSRGAGDLLYIADVRAGTVRRVQMPARSNPGRARLLRGSNGATLVAVALRDSGSIAMVSITGSGAPVITRILDVATCPTDVFQYDNATWVVDANTNCKVDYAVLGNARLIRIPNTGTTRDTIALPGARSSSVGATLVDDVAFLAAGGDANFVTFPYTLVSSGTITKVDLRNRRVLLQRAMPSGTYGATTKLGLDGFLYVSLYENIATFANRTLKLRTDDLSFVASGSTQYLPLVTAAGASVPCAGTTADALGRVHCIVNGTGSVTSLVVFNPSGIEIRRVPAGQGGVDLALR